MIESAAFCLESTPAMASDFAFQVEADAPLVPAPRPKPVLRPIYFLSVLRRSTAEVLPLAFRSLRAAQRHSQSFTADPDVALCEVTQLVRHPEGLNKKRRRKLL